MIGAGYKHEGSVSPKAVTTQRRQATGRKKKDVLISPLYRESRRREMK